MAFNGILKDIADVEAALERIDKQFEDAKKEREDYEQEWEDIIRRHAALGPNGGDTPLVQVTNLVRHYGPIVAKRFGVPGAAGAAGAAGATWLADDGAFAGVIAKIGQLFGG